MFAKYPLVNAFTVGACGTHMATKRFGDCERSPSEKTYGAAGWKHCHMAYPSLFMNIILVVACNTAQNVYSTCCS